MTNEGVKFDYGKDRWSLVPYDALRCVVRVFGFGAKKYGERNWENGFDWSRIFDSTQRHLTSYFQGEDNDPETGEPHLAHAACNILFLLTFQLRGVGKDDRPKNSTNQNKSLP